MRTGCSGLLFLALFAQQGQAQTAGDITVHGVVVDAAGKPVDKASVSLRGQQNGQPVEVVTDAAGAFAFAPLHAGSYQIQAAKADAHSQPTAIRDGSPLRLVMTPSAAMEFADQPNFTVAGVTDWTAVGGHGSDATLRTSEDLARETAALKAANGQGDADKHRLQAEASERAGDPLTAVREYQEAARLNPSEQNYFAWGSELLLHRAVWQAIEVFRNGNRLHPGSARMLTALGSALFAGDLFQEAAIHLCAASDLQPSEESPYRFLGRVVIASPQPLECVESRLARFAQQQPQSAQANYLYAIALWRRLQHAPAAEWPPVQSLLEKAVADDPRCADAWLQLGIMAAARQSSAEAIRDYSLALEADPKSGEAHYRLGVLYDRAGQAEKALREFQLHDQIEQSQAAEVERQRREVKQFLVTLQGEPAATH